MHRQPGQPPARLLPAFLLLACLLATVAAPSEVDTSVVTSSVVRSETDARDIKPTSYVLSADQSCAAYLRDKFICFARLDGSTPEIKIYGPMRATIVSESLFITDDNRQVVLTDYSSSPSRTVIVPVEDPARPTIFDSGIVVISSDKRWLFWAEEVAQERTWHVEDIYGTRPSRIAIESAYVVSTKDTFIYETDGSVYIEPCDGSASATLVAEDVSPAKSDQNFYYVTRLDEATGRKQLFAFASEAPQHLIALNPESNQVPDTSLYYNIPALSSPDGRFIAAFRAGSLLLKNVESLEPIRVLAEGISMPTSKWPAKWSPNSRFVCFNTSGGLYLYDIESAELPLRLTDGATRAQLFSGDSTTFLYVARNSYKIDLSTSLTPVEVPNNFADSVHLSWDGRYAAYSYYRYVYIVDHNSARRESIAVPTEYLMLGPLTPELSGGSFLLAAPHGNGATVMSLLDSESMQFSPLTRPPATIPGGMEIAGVSPGDQSVYFSVNDSTLVPSTVYGIPRGDPSLLNLLMEGNMANPTSMLRFAGNNRDAYFVIDNEETVYRSIGAQGASAIFSVREHDRGWSKTDGLEMHPDGRAANIISYHREDTCDYDDGCDEFGCCWSEEWYQARRVTTIQDENVASPFKTSYKISTLRNVPDSTGMLVPYNGYFYFHTSSGQMRFYRGQNLGIAKSPFDETLTLFQISVDACDGGVNCGTTIVSTTNLSLAEIDSAIQPEHFHTYDAIAPTQFSESTGRLILQPSDHTLQTLSILPGAFPVIVDDLAEATREGLVLSPDGLYAAYVRIPNETGHPGACTVDLKSDSPARQLSTWARGNTFAAVDALSFSPGSNAVLFIATEHSGSVCLYSAAPDASVPVVRRTPTSLEVVRYVVSPDSAWVAYAARDAGAPDDGVLTWYSVPLFGGTNARLIETDETLEGEPVWAGGNLYWIAKEETARVLYAAERTLSPPAFSTQPKPKGPLSVGRSAFLTARLVEPEGAAVRWVFAPSLPGGGVGPYTPLANTGGIRGATAHTLRINATRPVSQFAGRYRCVATNAAGFAYSRPVQIEVR